MVSKSDAWEAWIYSTTRADGSTWQSLMFFAGRAQKPTQHFRYRTRSEAMQALARFAAAAQGKAESSKATKAKAGPHDYAAGDVLVSVWGYDQTNIDYYQVTKVIGARMLEVRKIQQEILKTGDMNGRCVPLVGEFEGEPMRRMVGRGGSVNVMQSTFGRATKAEFTTIEGMRVYRGHAWSAWA